MKFSEMKKVAHNWLADQKLWMSTMVNPESVNRDGDIAEGFIDALRLLGIYSASQAKEAYRELRAARDRAIKEAALGVGSTESGNWDHPQKDDSLNHKSSVDEKPADVKAGGSYITVRSIGNGLGHFECAGDMMDLACDGAVPFWAWHSGCRGALWLPPSCRAAITPGSQWASWLPHTRRRTVMSELSIGQRGTIRLAYHAAEKSGNDAVLQNRIQQLSRDFGIGEDEVRKIIAEPADPTTVAKKAQGRHRGEWTPEQIRRLMELHCQGKGPTEIAQAMSMDVKRVTAKLYNLKKGGALAAPVPAAQAPAAPAPAVESATPKPESKVPDGIPAPAASAEEVPGSEPGVPKVPSVPTQPPEEPADDFPVDLTENEEYMKQCEREPEYEAALERLAEPEPKGIKLLTEIAELADHLECAYSAKIRLLQANPAAGWASCSFEAYGLRYSVSLRERRNDR